MNPRQAFLFGQLASVLVPIGMMIGTHINWMPDRMSKLRMGLKHAGFWGGLGANLALGHCYARPMIQRNHYLGLAYGLLAVGAALPMLGYWGGKRLGKTLFPDRTRTTEPLVPPIHHHDNRFKVPVLEEPEPDPPVDTDSYNYWPQQQFGYGQNSYPYSGYATVGQYGSYPSSYANTGNASSYSPYAAYSSYGSGYNSSDYGSPAYSNYGTYGSAYPAYNVFRTW